MNGLRSIVSDANAIQTIRLTDSTQKSFAANAIATQLREFQCNERIARTVAGAIDELLMNAIFDAPVDSRGQRLYDQTPRSKRIEISDVELQVAVDDNLIAISVVDSNGSLNRDTALDHIAKIFDSRFYKIRGPDYQGSGLGLSLVMKSGGSLAFVTKPGVRTEVTVFFRPTEKFKDFKNPFQFVATRVD
jgi:anti-sigma regulatory factor (Ser/Thr protein kinase)